MSKQFSVGMIIQGIDRVSGPMKGITASIRKMTLAEQEANKVNLKNKRQAASPTSKGRGGGMGSALGGGFGKAFGVIPQIAALAGGIAGVVTAYKTVTAASDEAEAAQLRLNVAMMKVKGTTKKDVDSVADLASELQKKTPIDDETLKSGAAQLAQFGMTGRQIRGILPAMTDYLAMTKGVNATTEDGVAAAKLFGKAYSGNTGALRKQGIVLTAAQEAIVKHGTAAQKTAVIIKAIESRSGGLAEKLGKTAQGQKKRLEQQINEIEESAGRALTPLREGAIKLGNQALPYLNRFADMLPNLLTKGTVVVKQAWAKLFGWFSTGFKGADLSGLLTTVVSVGQSIMKVFAPVYEWLYTAFGQIARWIVNMVAKSKPGLVALVEAFGPVLDVIKNLWKTILAPLFGWLAATAVPFLVNVLGPGLKWLVTQIAGVLNFVIKLFGGLIHWTGKIGSVVSGFFSDMWSKMRLGWFVFKTALTTAWHSLFDGLFGWIEEKWKGFIDLLKKVGQYLGFTGPDTTPSGKSGNQRPPALGGKWPLANEPLQIPDIAGRIAAIRDGRTPPPTNGKIQVDITHDGVGKVKAKMSDPFGLLQLGIQGVAH